MVESDFEDASKAGDVQNSSGELPKKKSAAERFKELKVKAQAASHDNRKQLLNEARKAKEDHTSKAQTSRKRLQAEIELAKIEAEEKGENFERKRAWDWTIEESEAWDEKLRQEKDAKASSIYSDLSTQAEKAYSKERRSLEPDLEKYKKQKSELANRSNAGPDFKSRPSKDSIDKLVSHLNEEDIRRTKRRSGQSDKDAVTYINEKNKLFSKRLSQHYDKYSGDLNGAEDGT